MINHGDIYCSTCPFSNCETEKIGAFFNYVHWMIIKIFFLTIEIKEVFRYLSSVVVKA